MNKKKKTNNNNDNVKLCTNIFYADLTLQINRESFLLGLLLVVRLNPAINFNLDGFYHIYFLSCAETHQQPCKSFSR